VGFLYCMNMVSCFIMQNTLIKHTKSSNFYCVVLLLAGITDVVIGMPHRGRVNVLAGALQVPSIALLHKVGKDESLGVWLFIIHSASKRQTSFFIQ